MISEVLFDTSPMTVGETRMLIVVADSPLAIAIQCFGSPPRPPVPRPCPECGEFSVAPGIPLPVTATASALRGFLDINIRDAQGDTRQIIIPVRLDDTEAMGSSGTSGNDIMGGGANVSHA